ncbi:MAG TPA: ABC transporter permease [Candidatus Marinimicrobia bacterium]|nr:ABC transporter permease [Candidatus Neomarinimicrobiota bacterium]HIB57837.1 ABC transporter permease [Candidatus Neomarinimicrobiota bacterium]
MGPLPLIAARHLRSKHKFSFTSFISYLAVAGLAIGVAVLILTLAVLDGFESEIEQKIIGFDGHIRIRGYFDRNLPEVDSHLDAILSNINDITASEPYISQAAMIRVGRETHGIMVEGVPSSGIEKIIATPQFITQGEFDLSGDGTVVMGAALANQLGLTVGKKVTLLDMANLGRPGKLPGIRQFRIIGIYDTGLKDYDETVVYMSLSDAQALFGMPAQISGRIVRLRDKDETESVSAAIASEGVLYISETWLDRHGRLFAWLRSQKQPMIIVFGLIALVAIFNISSALTMIVMEKNRDIGVLRAMGFSRRNISQLFLVEGGLVGLIGVGLGICLALIVGFLQIRYGFFRIPAEIYFMSQLAVKFHLQQFITVGAFGFLLALVATVYPAWKASGVQPADAVRYE